MGTDVSQDSEAEPTVSYALRYLAAGLSVVPIECDGTKRPPQGQAWKHLQERIASEAEVRRWFRGKTGVAVICGKVSGNLETLDIDAPELVEPFESAVREIAPGLLERLSTVATPRNNYGGRHYRYRIEGRVAGNTKLAQSELRPQFNDDGTPLLDLRTGKQKLAPETLIETRGEGGYAVVPGSPPECHEAGLPYKHLAGPPLTEIPTITAEQHRILWHVAKSFNRYLEQRDVTDGPAGGKDGKSPGGDFMARATWDDILIPAGWSKAHASGGVTFWRRPGKSTGISATTGVRSSAGTELLCVFSTNAFPFEGPANGRTCSSYSKFAAYAVLNHGGDYSAAAKDLAAKGFGDKPKPKSSPTKGPRLVLPELFQPFPVNVLPSLCAEFVRQSAVSIDCDESMIALPLLGAIAASIGNSCRIQLKRDYSEPSVIWAAIVCESGARKSAALESPLKPIRKREGEEIHRFNKAMEDYQVAMQAFKAATSGRNRKNQLAADPQPEPEKPVCRRFTVSDITSEALAVRLEQNPRGLLLVRDELAGFFTGLNQYKAGGKGGDEAAFLAMHGARPLVIDRKNPDKPSIYVPLANVSIVGAIQPGVLRRLFTRERMESGMAARFLLAYPPPRAVRWRENSVDATLEDRIGTMFDWLLSLRLAVNELTNEVESARLPLTSEAKERWISFHDEHAAEQADLQGDLSAAWAKLTGYAARLSLVCELASWATGDNWDPPTSVGLQSVEAGIALAKWFSAETKRIYAILHETDEQRDLRHLLDYVRRRGGRVTARDLARGPHPYRGNPELSEIALQQLVSAGHGTWESVPPTDLGGRPTRLFCLHPGTSCDETPAKHCQSEGFGTGTESFQAQCNSGDEEDCEWTA